MCRFDVLHVVTSSSLNHLNHREKCEQNVFCSECFAAQCRFPVRVMCSSSCEYMRRCIDFRWRRRHKQKFYNFTKSSDWAAIWCVQMMLSRVWWRSRTNWCRGAHNDWLQFNDMTMTSKQSLNIYYAIRSMRTGIDFNFIPKFDQSHRNRSAQMILN